MLTPDELALLESLLHRARHAAGAGYAALLDTVAPGDVVQLRPGADAHWETSLFLACEIREDGSISGQILRPHRGGYREAWYTYRPPAVARIGRMPFPEPGLAIRSWSYGGPPSCPVCGQRKPIVSEKRKRPDTSKLG
jgi:hypothetical protein